MRNRAEEEMKSSATRTAATPSSNWSRRWVGKFANRGYRHAYMEECVKLSIARQVRALREQREWSQEDLGRECGKPQSAISRIEDPDYGKLTLHTLLDLAKAYDLHLIVQFVDWEDWLNRTDNATKKDLKKAASTEAHLRPLAD